MRTASGGGPGLQRTLLGIDSFGGSRRVMTAETDWPLRWGRGQIGMGSTPRLPLGDPEPIFTRKSWVIHVALAQCKLDWDPRGRRQPGRLGLAGFNGKDLPASGSREGHPRRR